MRQPRKFFRIWSGRWESNPRPKLGKLLYCHCTTPALRSLYLRIGQWGSGCTPRYPRYLLEGFREFMAVGGRSIGRLRAGFVAVRRRIGEAARCGQVANVYDDGPDFVVA